jgi:hypothetical protein
VGISPSDSEDERILSKLINADNPQADYVKPSAKQSKDTHTHPSPHANRFVIGTAVIPPDPPHPGATCRSRTRVHTPRG